MSETTGYFQVAELDDETWVVEFVRVDGMMTEEIRIAQNLTSEEAIECCAKMNDALSTISPTDIVNPASAT